MLVIVPARGRHTEPPRCAPARATSARADANLTVTRMG